MSRCPSSDPWYKIRVVVATRHEPSRVDVVFRPRQMRPEALLDGYQTANRRFYALSSIVRRLSRSPVGLWWTLPLNLAHAYALKRARPAVSAL